MKHLGSNQTQYKDQYDPSLLERIERAPRRQGYVKMYGFDVWTAYEFSFLSSTGLPRYKVIRIITDCENPFIFESKSLKLYLNSFNNTMFDFDEQAIEVVERDLCEVAGGRVMVVEIKEFNDGRAIYNNRCVELQSGRNITTYQLNKSLLKTFDLDYQLTQSFYTDLLRSNCEITNQPDWGRCFVNLVADKQGLISDSVLEYIVSYRNHQEFHEPTCERIFQDILEVTQPIQLMVICQYTRRGGIDINPIRSLKPIDRSICFDLPKLLQQ